MTVKLTKRKKQDILREAANHMINRNGADWKEMLHKAEKTTDADEALDLLDRMARKEDRIYEELAKQKKTEEKRQFTWEEMVRRRCDCAIHQACLVDNLPYVDCYLCFSEGTPPKPGIGKARLEAMKLAEIERRKKLGLTTPEKVVEEPDMPEGIVKDLRDANNGLLEAQRKILRIKKRMEAVRSENTPEKEFSVPTVFDRIKKKVGKWQKSVATDLAPIFLEQAKKDIKKKSTYKNMLVRCLCGNLTSNKNNVCPSCAVLKTLETVEKEARRRTA